MVSSFAALSTFVAFLGFLAVFAALSTLATSFTTFATTRFATTTTFIGWRVVMVIATDKVVVMPWCIYTVGGHKCNGEKVVGTVDAQFQLQLQ